MSMKNREKLKHYFKTYPNQPIPAATLSAIGGACAWRTRVSELRTIDGMNIKNVVRHVKTDDGHIKVSEYKYIPDQPVRPTTRAKHPARLHHKKPKTQQAQPTLPPRPGDPKPLTQPALF